MYRTKLIFYNKVFRRSLLMSSVVLTPNVIQNENKTVTSSPSTTKSEETGWDRLRTMYSFDEWGNISKELNAVFQTTCFSGFIGACYGGFLFSREAYFDFLERNQATQFSNHLEAKRRLQNHVTVNFGRGALKWAWRLSLFCGFFTLTFHTATIYRGYTSIFDYIGGGILAGTFYQFKLGPRGMLVGASLGGVLGLLTGALAQTLLSISGGTIEDLVTWQNKFDIQRNEYMRSAERKRIEEQMGDKSKLLEHHVEVHSADKENKL